MARLLIDYWYVALLVLLAWLARRLLYRIWCYYRMQRRRDYVLANGVNVRAVVVQANDQLFMPGDVDSPAQVIFTFDKELPDAVAYLRAVADRMFALKGKNVEDPIEHQVSALVTDETFIPGSCLPLPDEFTEGKRVFVAHVMIERKYLPDRCLPGPQGYIQCITMPDGKDAVHMTAYLLEPA